MYNHNNLWPSISPLNTYGYATQPLNQMQTNVLQQNVNHLSPYYNQNQNYGLQYNSGYNLYGSPPVQPAQPVHPVHPNQNLVSSYLTHPNQSFSTNTLTQSYVSPNERPIQTLTTIQTTDYTPNANPSKSGENDEWMELLNASQKQVLDQLNKETEAFEQQFQNWEKDFENWKQVNRSHPDSNAYQLYVNQWQEWRQKLIERQQQMKDLRTRTLNQLYSQVRPQLDQMSAKPPLPPNRLEVPPPPPPPEKRESHPPPPPPPPTEPNSCGEGSNNSSFLSPQKRSENNLRLNSNELNSKQENKSIEIIEIDCEPKCVNVSETESVTTADPNAVSKAAEALLFIRKQQELLKSLENLKSVKSNDKSCDNSSDDLQVIEPKPFDMKDIVTKMKAIRPPENPTEANKILSTLPSLQGIVFQPKPNQNDSDRDLIGRSSDSSNSHTFEQNNNSFPTFQSNPAVNQPFRPPMPPNFSNRPNFMQMNENQWKSPNASASRDDQKYYQMNDKPTPQQPNSIRKYSAQTIDYNHRHENNDSNSRTEPPVETQSYLPQKSLSSPLNNNFYHQMNANHSFNRQMFNDLRTPMPENVEEKAPIEESLTYRDMRYFTQPKSRIVPIDDLLKPPTRDFRPENIVIILRGLPGSGKTFIAKLIKEKEMEFGRSTPRILSIDDYFMSEVERQIKVPETGKTVKSKEYVYEYEKEMESCYRASLLKTYKKTVDDRLFSFIIIDAVNDLIGDITDFYSYAIKSDFVVYVIEMVSNDPLVCHKNNTHNRTLDEIKQIHKKWQTLPEFMLRLDIRSLIQNASIKNVEMEDNSTEDTLKRKAEIEPQVFNKDLKTSGDSEGQAFNSETRVSRWERMEASESKLDKLDSFRMKTKPTIEEYLQVTDDYDLRLRDKQKRVRWADIEEQKKQQHMRQRGFVVGLDWHQYMDPQHPQRVLTETKYF